MTSELNTAEERAPSALERMPASEPTPPESGERLISRGREQVAKLMADVATSQAALSPEDDVFSEDFRNLRKQAEAAQAELEGEIADIETGSPTPDIDRMIGEELAKGATPEMPEPLPTRDVPDWYEPNLDPLELEDRVDAVVNEATEPGHIAFDTLARLADLVTQDKNVHERAKNDLASAIGPKYAERLLSEGAYRERLHRLQETLARPYGGEGGPRICREAGLDHLIVIDEILGDRTESMMRALDIRRYGQGLDTGLTLPKNADGEPDDLLKVYDAIFDQEGNLSRGSLEIGFRYDYESVDEEGMSVGERASIVRTFALERPETPSAPAVGRKTAYHSLFELPVSMKGAGLAAEVTAASLEEYDRMGIDDIKLHANIEQGGYAWASYGYGWDEQHTTERDVADIIGGMKAAFLDAMREADIDPSTATATLAEIDGASRNPLACTPQHLALIGKDGPLFRRGASGRLYSDEAFQTALADGSESGELETMRGPLHAGKIGLMGASWYGRMDLKPDGPQGGSNRKILEEKIARTKR